MSKSLLLLLFLAGCTNSIFVDTHMSIPVFEQDRKGKMILKTQDTLLIDNVTIADKSIRFVNRKSNLRSEIPIKSVSSIEFFSRGAGAFRGALFGLFCGFVTAEIINSGLEQKIWDDGEDDNRETIAMGQAATSVVYIGGGTVVCSILGYAFGYKEIYTFK